MKSKEILPKCSNWINSFIKCLALFVLFAVPVIACSASAVPKADVAVKAYVDLEQGSNGNISKEEQTKEELKVQPPIEVVIVIDPGHGGEELGTYHGKMYEKNVNLDISLRFGELLRKEGVKVAFTREKDEFVSLQERADFANNLDAALFISVHNNAMPGQPDYKGTETLYCPPQTPVFSKMDGKKLAVIVQKELVKTLKTYDNGIIYRPNLAVVRRTKMPAVIAEIGYISNASDRAKLATSEFRYKAARALVNAVLKALDEMGAYRDKENNKLMINRD